MERNFNDVTNLKLNVGLKPEGKTLAFFFRALIESLLEAGKFKDAIDVSANAASFTKRHVPHLFKEVFRLQVHTGISFSEIQVAE